MIIVEYSIQRLFIRVVYLITIVASHTFRGLQFTLIGFPVFVGNDSSDLLVKRNNVCPL